MVQAGVTGIGIFKVRINRIPTKTAYPAVPAENLKPIYGLIVDTVVARPPTMLLPAIDQRRSSQQIALAAGIRAGVALAAVVSGASPNPGARADTFGTGSRDNRYASEGAGIAVLVAMLHQCFESAAAQSPLAAGETVLPPEVL